MISKIDFSFRNKYILFAVIALIIFGIYQIMGKYLILKLDEQDYTLIECHVGYEFSTNDMEKISNIVDFLNTNKFYKTFRWVDTLSSPEIVMMLLKKDGTTDKIEFYGGAWEDGLYLLYNDTQYKIKNPDKFYKNIETFLGSSSLRTSYQCRQAKLALIALIGDVRLSKNYCFSSFQKRESTGFKPPLDL